MVEKVGMQRLLLLAAVLAAQCGLAEPLSQRDRDFALNQFQSSRKALLEAVAGLSTAQWSFKPAPDRWSVAECFEHISVVEEALFGTARKRIEGPANPERRGELKANDERILKTVSSRERKAKAPEPVQPRGRWESPAALLEHFGSLRGRIIAYITTTGDDLRSHFGSCPTEKVCDAFQVLLTITAHCERHTAQILEVKADQGFPKN